MNILITGGLGHIGTYFVENSFRLKKIKKIIILDYTKENFLKLINLKNKSNIYFFNHDLTNKQFINKIKNIKIDIVLHLASLTNAEESFKIKNKINYNNLTSFKNVLDLCKKKKSKLVHISSTSVYGVSGNLVNENSKVKPQSPYAEIKVKEEMILQKVKNLKFISLRFGTIVGVSSGMRFHTAVNRFCMESYLKKPLNIWTTAYRQFRPYLSIGDAFKAVNFIIQKNIFNNQTYNIVSGNYTVKQIVNMISKFEKPVMKKFVNSKIMNQLSYKVSNKKFSKVALSLKGNIQNDIKQIFKSLPKKI